MSYTLTTLKSAIQDYTENTETTFVSNLRSFIRAAENRLFKMIDFEVFRRNSTSATTSSDRFLSVPTDFFSPFSLSITSSNNMIFLLEKDVNFVQEYHPNSSTTGTPKYYARFDVDNFILAPTGGTSGATATIDSKNDSANTLTIVVPTTAFTSGETITGGTTSHSSAISAITSDTTTTWLSKNAINAMLYGSLIEAYIFMKGEPDVIKMYGERFMEEVHRLKDFGEARENAADAYRQGLPTIPRT